MEIIHLVEHSYLSIRKTCAELDVARSTFYRWYSRYQEEGFDGLMDRQPEPRQFCLPWWVGGTGSLPQSQIRSLPWLLPIRRNPRGRSPGFSPINKAISSRNPACIAS